jgi:invasion protein IalB
MNGKIIKLLLLFVLLLAGCGTTKGDSEPIIDSSPTQVEINEETTVSQEKQAVLQNADEKLNNDGEVIEELSTQVDEANVAVEGATKSGNKEFIDWVARCNVDGLKGCMLIYQKKNESNQRIIQFNIYPGNSEGNSPRVSAVLPFGLHLPDQAHLSLGISSNYQLTMQKCVEYGCIASADEPGQLIAELRDGVLEKGTVSVSVRDNKGVMIIDFSRRGFAEAYTYATK